jgi:hypothetical protein
MNHIQCGRESELIAAILSGVEISELNAHVEHCPTCTETRKVALLMTQYAEAIEAQRHDPPIANWIWIRAQRQRRALALKRVKRTLFLMWCLGAMYAAALTLWCAQAWWRTQSAEIMMTLASKAVVPGTVVIVAVVALGICFLLSSGKQSNSTVAST